MKKIVFFNTKGGTGKTTICFNYGWYLAEKQDKKVLFLDFDPQVSLFQAFFKNLQTPRDRCLENLIVNYLSNKKIDFDDYVIKVNDKIDILPSSNNISLLEEYITDYFLDKTFYDNTIYNSSSRVSIISSVLEEFIPQKYDYIIIDSQPNYSLLSSAAMIFAKNVVIVLKPEIFSFLDIKYLNRIINNLYEKFKVEVNIIGILINGFEKRRKTAETIIGRLSEKYSGTFDIIPEKVRYLSSYHASILLDRKPVFISFPKSDAAKDLLEAFKSLDLLIKNKLDLEINNI
jgi:chromosome partitioning protein